MVRCNASLAVTQHILKLGGSFSITINMDLSGDNNALAFSTDVYSKGEDADDVTLAEVRQIYRDRHGEEVTMDEVSGEDSAEDLDNMVMLNRLHQRILSGSHWLCCNTPVVWAWQPWLLWL